jgi:hypothetical protein
VTRPIGENKAVMTPEVREAIEQAIRSNAQKQSEERTPKEEELSP